MGTPWGHWGGSEGHGDTMGTLGGVLKVMGTSWGHRGGSEGHRATRGGSEDREDTMGDPQNPWGHRGWGGEGGATGTEGDKGDATHPSGGTKGLVDAVVPLARRGVRPFGRHRLLAAVEIWGGWGGGVKGFGGDTSVPKCPQEGGDTRGWREGGRYPGSSASSSWSGSGWGSGCRTAPSCSAPVWS